MGYIMEPLEMQELKKQIRELKEHIADLMLQRDELRFVICENIKTEYMLTIGQLEYKVYQAYCQYLRLRRKKEMMQACKNRKQPIRIDEIERTLNVEFLEYQQKLDEKIREMKEALNRSKMDLLSPEKTSEIKKKYHMIVKQLHPDLHPSLSDAKKELFYQATEAFARKKQDELVQYLFHQGTGLDLPKPFERDIFLFDTYVAGTTHVPGIENLEHVLQEGEKLVFYREPENPHDPQAIRIETIREEKVGYVPEQDNVVFSRLMDAGKVLFGQVSEKEMRGKWLRLKIKIFLHES